MQESLLLCENTGKGVIKLKLNHPTSRNAMSEAMGQAFENVITSLRGEANARVIVLTGEGQAFSGGGHLDMLAEKPKLSIERNREQMEKFYRQFLSVLTLEVPVIAAINGHAMGAGLCLAMACDIRIAADTAKLGLNFVHLGLHPGMGATYFLPRLVGMAKAAELLYVGKVLSAAEAKEIGLVNRVVKPEDFATSVDELAESIAGAGPQAIRNLKQSLKQSMQLPLQDCLAREAACQALDYAGPEFLEGITAAREKRKPRFN